MRAQINTCYPRTDLAEHIRPGSALSAVGAAWARSNGHSGLAGLSDPSPGPGPGPLAASDRPGLGRAWGPNDSDHVTGIIASRAMIAGMCNSLGTARAAPPGQLPATLHLKLFRGAAPGPRAEGA